MKVIEHLYKIQNEFMAEYNETPLIIMHPEIRAELDRDLAMQRNGPANFHKDKYGNHLIEIHGMKIKTISEVNRDGLSLRAFDAYDEPIIYAVSDQDTKIIDTGGSPRVEIPLRQEWGRKMKRAVIDTRKGMSEQGYSVCIANTDHARDMVWKLDQDDEIIRVGAGRVGETKVVGREKPVNKIKPRETFSDMLSKL
jgi:hypothetical protein